MYIALMYFEVALHMRVPKLPRTLPVANVVVVVTSLESEVVRVDKKCNVTGVLYAW